MTDDMELPRNRRSALAIGSKFYNTGKPCCHTHIAKRRTDTGTCIKCDPLPIRRRRIYLDKMAPEEFKIATQTCQTCGRIALLSDFGLENNGSRKCVRSECSMCRKTYQSNYKSAHEPEIRAYSAAKKRREDDNPDRIGLWAIDSVRHARNRAKRAGVPFDLDVSYVRSLCVTHCPALGTPLVYANIGGHKPNSASIDRIVPSGGYTRGNVMVISRRANTIKQDATAAELAEVAHWVHRIMAKQAA